MPVAAFEDKHYEFDGQVSQVDAVTKERLTIGDVLRVRSAAADVSSGRIDFVPAQEDK